MTEIKSMKLDCPAQLTALGFSLRTEIQADLSSLRQLYRSQRWREFSSPALSDIQIQALIDSPFDLQHKQYAQHPNAQLLILLDAAHSLVGRLYISDNGYDIRIIDILLRHELRNQDIGLHLPGALLNQASQIRVSENTD